MGTILNFIPNSEEERQFFEAHSALSRYCSGMIRALPAEQRLEALKQSEPTDVSLMALYLWALQREDYETCNTAKALLIERGFAIPE